MDSAGNSLTIIPNYFLAFVFFTAAFFFFLGAIFFIFSFISHSVIVS